MTVRIGINGIGRIGRNLWRIIRSEAPDVRVVAVNDTADLATVAHLLRYDTVRGRFPGVVDHTGDAIVVDGTEVPMSHATTPAGVDWRRHGVDLVVEATGQFARGPAARGHLSAGAPTVVVSTASPDTDIALMMGINEHEYRPGRHLVVSNSCCTTYCLAAMTRPLHRAFGVLSGAATIAYSHGSRPGPLLDGMHPHPRMARANAVSIVPAGVPGVRHALDRVLPELAGRITATAMRVPVRATSAATLTLRLARPACPEEIRATLRRAAAGRLRGYLEISEAPTVSCDVIGRTASCVLDVGLVTVLGDLVRLVGWYDNEWGYAHRLLDLIRYLADHPVRGRPRRTGPPAVPPGASSTTCPDPARGRDHRGRWIAGAGRGTAGGASRGRGS